MEDRNLITSATSESLVSDADDRPLKKRGIIIHSPSVSLVDLPSIAFANILSRLPLDDIFINLFFVCKDIKQLTIELIEQHPHYFTKIYEENYPGSLFLVTRIGRIVRTYFGVLRRADEIERRSIFWRNRIEYLFATTRWTRQNMRCRFDDIRLTYNIEQGVPFIGKKGRGIIVSCNGILCLRRRKQRNLDIVVMNPIFGDDDDNEFIPEPKYQISKYQILDFLKSSYLFGNKKVDRTKELVLVGSGMGFGCTSINRDRFKVLIVKNYVCDSRRYGDGLYDDDHDEIIKIGIDNQPCFKSTCEIRTLGIDHDWRVLPEKDCWFWCCHSHTIVTFDGTFYWIGHCSKNDGGLLEDPSASRCVCVAFDIEEEKARSIKLPPQFRHIDDYYGGLVVLGKNLCLYDNTTFRGHIMIWKMMMEETKIEHCIWSVEFIINKSTLMPSPTNYTLYEHTHYVPITMLPTGEIMMYCRLHSASCIYDPNTKEVPYYIGIKESWGDQAITYMPNFASLKDVIKRGVDPTNA